MKIPEHSKTVEVNVIDNSNIILEIAFKMPYEMFIGEKYVNVDIWKKKVLNYAIKEFEKLREIKRKT